MRSDVFRWDRARVLALLAIFALHLALIALLWRSTIAVRTEEPAPAMQIVLLLPSPVERPTPSPRTREPAEIQPLVPPERAAPSEGVPAEGSNAPSAAPLVDWQREGIDAAHREAQAHPLPPLEEKRKPFAWSHSHIKRIEKVEGAYLLWLSDQCALVNFIFPACKLGKKPPRGDLFDGMKQALAEADETPSVPAP
jgi:hypothetical protein